VDTRERRAASHALGVKHGLRNPGGSRCRIWRTIVDVTMSLVCDAVIFDLDGILVDSNAISERHWRVWAEHRAIPFEQIAAIHHGRPTVETIRLVAPHLHAETEAHEKEAVEADDTLGLVVFDGATRLLSRLTPERWAIVTSGTRRTVATRLAHLGLPTPQVLVTADDVAHGKPAPDPYLLAAERLGLAPSRCVVVEDAPAGVASARAAGAVVIGVASTNSAIALVDADVVVARLADIEIDTDTTDGALRVSWTAALEPR
jgi:sugar-phosphatase